MRRVSAQKLATPFRAPAPVSSRLAVDHHLCGDMLSSVSSMCILSHSDVWLAISVYSGCVLRCLRFLDMFLIFAVLFVRKGGLNWRLRDL